MLIVFSLFFVENLPAASGLVLAALALDFSV